MSVVHEDLIDALVQPSAGLSGLEIRTCLRLALPNPKDTKDYPGGVWTLPPSLRYGEQDKAKYLAIGESDRMTLRFIKPVK